MQSRFSWDKNSVDFLFKDTTNQKFIPTLFNDFLLAFTLLTPNAVQGKLANPKYYWFNNEKPQNPQIRGRFFLKKGAHMNLGKGIEVLVKDWIDLHEQGGTKLSVEAVIIKLGVDKSSAMKAHTNTLQIVELLQRRIRQIPGALDIVEKFMAQFSTPEDLLDEMDLDSFVCDLDVMEANDL